MNRLVEARPSGKGGASGDVYSPDAIGRALRALLVLLAPLLAPMVARELRGRTTEDDADPWVDQACSPLGRRAHCRACAAGKIEGARKVGKRWLARRSALDAYVQAHGRAPRVEDAPASGVRERDTDEPTEAEIAAELRAVGLYYTGGRS